VSVSLWKHILRNDGPIPRFFVRIVKSAQEAKQTLTDLLKKAFEAASRLPEDEQDAVAEWLLAELASEEGWKGRFARTQDALSALAHEALDEYERGEAKEDCF
jgi:hypothetical protein